jgi:hypothetical protein
VNVVAVPLEHRVLIDIENYVEIAGGTSPSPCIALARQSDLRTVLYACRYVDLELARTAFSTFSAAALAGVGHDLATASAPWTRLDIDECSEGGLLRLSDLT